MHKYALYTANDDGDNTDDEDNTSNKCNENHCMLIVRSIRFD